MSWHFDHKTNTPSIKEHVTVVNPVQTDAQYQSISHSQTQPSVVEKITQDDTHDFVVVPTQRPAIDINIKRDMVEVQEEGNFLADIGVVYPLVVKGYDYSIDGFNKQPLEIQQEIAYLLHDEWGTDKLTYTNEYIQKNWASTDVLYILVSNGKVIGCVAIDRHKFYPFISHLYIKKEYRGLGYASNLLELCEEYAKKQLKFTEIKLWCEERLVKFYQKQGWSIESVDEQNIFVMSKHI